MPTKFDIEPLLLGALRPLFVGKRLRVSRRRKPRLCTAVEMGWDERGEHCDVVCLDFTYEDGSTEQCHIHGNVEVFEENREAEFVALRSDKVLQRLTEREEER